MKGGGLKKALALLLFIVLSGCQKKINYDDFPETKYPDSPTNGAWENPFDKK